MPRWMLVTWLLIGLSLPAGNGVLAQSSEGAATPVAFEAARTNVHYFLPYSSGDLNPDLVIVSDETGSCDHTSLDSVARPDAWRCYAEGGVLDPCFENPWGDVDAPAVLACSSSPFSSEIVRFTTDAPLERVTEKEDDAAGPGDAARPPALPWAFELANGARCEILSGATQVFAGMRVNYGCDDQGLVIGEVDESQPLWVVNYLPEDGSATELVEVTDAWY